ncbi:MAG: hypothetical protein WC527_02055 [Candidatus Margulisiibacteriota bacterium]
MVEGLKDQVDRYMPRPSIKSDVPKSAINESARTVADIIPGQAERPAPINGTSSGVDVRGDAKLRD